MNAEKLRSLREEGSAKSKKLDYDLWPTFWEVDAAKMAFFKYALAHQEDILSAPGTPGHMTQDTGLTCALAEVWRQGRIYQRDQDAKALAEAAFPAATSLGEALG